MFGTAQYNEDPVQGPEENPVLQASKLRDWIKKQTLNEERLEFNKSFKSIDAPFQARHDKDFILPDAFSQLALVPKQPELHGLYSIPMTGSTVPGQVDGRLRNVGLVNNSDLVPNNLERGTGSIASVPRAPGIGDKLNDDKLLGALRKMLFKGTADDKDIEARQMDRFANRRWRGM